MSDRTGKGAGRRMLLVTGMSGAGRSTALDALEDLGYQTVDNLPSSLMPALIDTVGPGMPALAIGLPVRNSGFPVEELVHALGSIGRSCTLVFLDCDDARLCSRYTVTRRPHPLAGGGSVIDGIRRERQLVSAMRERADLVIDTSEMTTAGLKRLLAGHFALEPGRLRIFVTSFSFRNGIPKEADLVFDVRFLSNPYYVPELRNGTGLDAAVGAHIARDADFDGFFEGVWQLLRPLLPRYEKEGKAYLTIAIGCTGGRHRSVFVAERLGQRLREGEWPAQVAHRDLSPDSARFETGTGNTVSAA